MAKQLYDTIGGGYSATRQTDPRIAAILWEQLGSADRVLNVGAGAGSYEPADRRVVAVEPSATMRAQRPAGAAPCVAGVAEALPFPDASFDVAMGVLSDWYWPDRRKGFDEMRRVARARVLLLTIDRSVAEDFWLSAEYLPRAHDLWGEFCDTLSDFGQCETLDVPIPADCIDGFFHAYWRRPHAYLQDSVRQTMAVFNNLDPAEAVGGITRLAHDLDSGDWRARHADLLQLETLDMGYRLLVRDV
jgi:SAM-dependent methyltransferase